jgi:nucleotide-binding universal stress UspA family protein
MSTEKTQPDSKFELIPMKKVLIALDYDPSAKKVAEKGYTIAKSMNAEVILFHVTAEYGYYSTTEYSPIIGFVGFSNNEFSEKITTEGITHAAKYFLGRIKDHFGDETIQTMIAEGDLAETILKTAKQIHADLIVMGSHSKRWLEELLLGSTTKTVLHASTTPLCIIPTKKRQ